jgi:hypothetical protein
MVIASILILGMVPLATGDATGRASAPVAVHIPGIHAAPSIGSRAAHPRPRGSRRALLFWEEEEEDDTSDDEAPRESALGSVAQHPGAHPGGPFAHQGTRRILSRSASPTLRLRC